MGSRARLHQAGYWIAVGGALLAWHELLCLLASYPLPVHLALVAMVAVAGLWGHTILFPRRPAEARAAPVAAPAVIAPQAARRTASAPARAVRTGPAAPVTERLSAAIEAGTGQRMVARLVDEPAGTTVALMPEPRPEDRLPLPLMQQFCALVAAESRTDTRAALAAVLRAGAGPTMQAVMEAYVRENVGRPHTPPAVPHPVFRPAEPAPVTRWQLIDGALPGATGRAS